MFLHFSHYVFEYHNEHGIKADRAVVQHFATDTIMIKKQMSFKQVADSGCSYCAIAITKSVVQIEYNSFYNDENHYLRLPKKNSRICFE
jgi:membrane-bound lytic murein transglycosylase D